MAKAQENEPCTKGRDGLIVTLVVVAVVALIVSAIVTYIMILDVSATIQSDVRSVGYDLEMLRGKIQREFPDGVARQAIPNLATNLTTNLTTTLVGGENTEVLVVDRGSAPLIQLGVGSNTYVMTAVVVEDSVFTERREHVDRFSTTPFRDSTGKIREIIASDAKHFERGKEYVIVFADYWHPRDGEDTYYILLACVLTGITGGG